MTDSPWSRLTNFAIIGCMRHGMHSPSAEVPGERQFHEGRWQRQAEKHNKNWLRTLMGKRRKEWTDFMYEEALRENEYFNKLQSAEGKKWNADLQRVIDRLKEKRDNPEQDGITSMLVVLGGALKCPPSAGQAMGLNHVGLTADTFHTVVGISGGAGTAAYFAAGSEQTAIGASIFYNFCMTKPFLDLARANQIMSVKALTEDAMGAGDTCLDEERILASEKTKLLFGVTQLPENGDEPVATLMDAKEVGIRRLMRTSMSIPIITGQPPPINGVEYVDGSFDPLPIKELVAYAKENGITDILVLPNIPFDQLDAFNLSPGEYVLAELTKLRKKNSSKPTRPGVIDEVRKQVHHFIRIKQRLRKALDAVQKETGINIGVLWPPDLGLSELGQDGDRVQAAVTEAARDTIARFGAAQPQNLRLYQPR